jgi:uncharacterized protein (TIGR03437 family)
VVKSVDGGATWISINGNLPQPNGGFPPAARGIWIDPNHPSVLFTLGVTTDYFLARTADGGATWQVLHGTPVPINGALTFDPFTSGKVYAADGSTMSVSLDDGVTWAPLGLTGVAYSEPYVILPDPAHAGVLYGGAQDAVWKSTDSGTTWVRKAAVPASLLVLDPSTGAVYAAAKYGTTIMMTTDFFETSVHAGPAGFGELYALVAAGGHAFAGSQATSDVFVMKFDPQGNVLYSTYFGGASTEVAHAMSVDPMGGVYVTGTTQSADFPVTAGSYAKTPGPGFVFKLNADGSLAWSTYFGLPPSAIAVDDAGHAYITGTAGYPTSPSNPTLPFQTTPGSYQPKFDGTFCGIGCLISIPPTNGFLTEFDINGASQVFSTYLGTQSEVGTAVTPLPDGSVVVTGGETIYHLDPTGSSLLGKKSLIADMRALSNDGAGNILLVGATQSFTFPTTPGVFQPSAYPGLLLPGTLGNYTPGDAFVMRLDPQLNVLTCTLIGGESTDVALRAAPAADGSIIVGGSTSSRAFPTHGPPQSSFANGTGFLTQFTSDLSSLAFSTYVGDARNFYVQSLAATPDGGIVFGGSTASPPYFSVERLGAGPGVDAFVVKVTPTGAAPPRIDSVVNAASQLAVPLSPGETFQVHGSAFGDDSVLLLNGSPLPLIDHDGTTLTATVPTDFTAQSANLEVDTGGGRASILVAGAPASPGVFSTDGSGYGQGYILNKDGTLNSTDNPAKEGDEITIYATGVGGMTFDRGYAVTNSPVNVLIDGFLAAGIAAVLGPVPGLPGNVYQISVYVPRPSDYAAANPNLQGFVMPPQVAVVFQVNGVYSQAGVSLKVTH